MSSVERETHYEFAGSKPASTIKTDVLTCPSPTGGGIWYTITGLNICASDGNAGTADVFFFDGTVEYTLRKAAVVPAAGSIDIEFRPVVLTSGQKLRVTPSVANQHVTVSYIVGRPNPNALGRNAGTP